MIRREPLYVSTEVWRWLWLLSKSESVPEENRITTADEIADQILRQAIREQHPQLATHQKEIEKLEKTLIESLRTKQAYERFPEGKICGDRDP